MALHFEYKSFDNLSAPELYAILRLRNEVFVVEQNCVYQDADDKDQDSFHLTGYDQDTNALVAYCRILPPGISFKEASIGRVAVSPDYRHFGYGRNLMELAVAFTFQLFECSKITIGAQEYLKKFYQSFGFVQKGKPYLEDNISHIKMQLSI